MKPKLPRALLWRDKNTMDEMLKEPFGGQLYHMFISISRNMRMRFSIVFHMSILNEVFYQCIRVTYEKDPNAKVRDYEADIKANVGGLQGPTKMVLTLMMYLLMAQSDKSDEVSLFIERLKLYFTKPGQYFLDLQAEECFLMSFPYENNGQGLFLVPEPCRADDLEGMVIDWEEVTRGYSKQMIREVLLLWKNSREQKKVLSMIEQDYHKRVLSLFDKEPQDVADDEFFRVYLESLNADNDIDEERNKLIECNEKDSELLLEMKEKLTRMEKRNSELETEIIGLKSELNNHKQEGEQERAFTLQVIVDYCKNCVQLGQVEGIIKMLNIFLRKNGTDEEYGLIDSIEEEFKNRRYGNTFVEQQTVIPNVGNYQPQIKTQNMSIPLPPTEEQKKKLIANE